jgi:hypothetical protein
MYLLSVVELVTVCIVVALECVRAALDEDFSPWEDGLLEGVAVAVLLLSPLIVPSVATLGEWVTTAYLLAFYETKLARAVKKQVGVGKWRPCRVCVSVDGRMLLG